MGLASAAASGQDKPAVEIRQTFAVETFVGRAYNYLDTDGGQGRASLLQHLLDRARRGGPRLARFRRRDQPPASGEPSWRGT